MSGSPFHIFGVRHHGPGCARTLARSLESLQPDCILIEGPPESNELIQFVTHEQMRPPVALLVHAEGDASQSAFYPFAEFSPEWQAMHWGQRHGVPVRFMDLPVCISLALAKEAKELAGKGADDDSSQDDLFTPDGGESTASDADDAATGPGHLLDTCRSDPLTHLAIAAGYADGEAWWNHMVEERGDGRELFEAIAEAMRALRAELPDVHRSDLADRRREDLREAHMRQTMREAQKEGFQRIAVICGAWHLPALESKVTAKADASLLKGLPKTKTSVTWVPWTYSNLARSSGYGAGIHSPGWYEHLWRHDPQKGSRAVGWLSRIAGLLRKNNIDCSSAHIIEAVRLAETLSSIRGRPAPGLEELEESVKTVIFMGNAAQLDLIRQELSIGNRIGEVPDSVPMVPLQQDIERAQKRLRFKPEAFSKTVDLDLRNETDLARSQLLHRLKMLGIPWGSLVSSGNTRGTFKESWSIQWTPACPVAVIEASHWGLTVEAAASTKVVGECMRFEDLSDLATAVDQVLLADLQAAVEPVSKLLEERASLTGDTAEMLLAVPPLANIHRYGSVRKFDTSLVARVLDGVVTRASIGLLTASCGINEEVATKMHSAVIGAHGAIGIRQSEDLSQEWSRALGYVSRAETADALLKGLTCRLVFDQRGMSREDVEQQLWLNLSAAQTPLDASRWLDGFLNRNALVLLHDAEVWGLVNDWVACLPEEAFVRILPLVRRTFSAFQQCDRQQLATLAAKGQKRAPKAASSSDWDAQRASLVLPILSKIFGVAA